MVQVTKAQIKANRRLIRDVIGSKEFTFRNSSLADGSSFRRDFWHTTNAESKYAPFNNIVIRNTSTNAITLTINDDTNTTKILDGDTIQSFESPPDIYSFKLTNNSGSTITANDLEVRVSRKQFDANRQALENKEESLGLKIFKKIIGV